MAQGRGKDLSPLDKEEARYLGASVRARKEPACAFSKVFAAAPRRQSGSVAGLNVFRHV